MRVESNGINYEDCDPGYIGYRKRSFGFLGRFKQLSNAANIRQHYGDVDNVFVKLHDRIWGKLYTLVAVGGIALIACAVSWLFGMAIPANWTFVTGLLNVVRTVGWWIFIICAAIVILGLVCGLFCKFTDWLKSKG